MVVGCLRVLRDEPYLLAKQAKRAKWVKLAKQERRMMRAKRVMLAERTNMLLDQKICMRGIGSERVPL